MTEIEKIELLKQFGFFEKDGWLCNPKLGGEAVFKIGDPRCGLEHMSLPSIMEVITATALNAGSRYQREEMRKNVADCMKRSLSRWMNDFLETL